MAISSQYYRDLSKVEKKIWNVSIRQIKAYTMLGFVSAVLVAETIFLPDWAFFLMTIPTAFILGFYPMLLLLNKWKDFKRKIALYFMYEDCFYQTGQIRRYAKDEFNQKQGVKETVNIA